MPLPQAQDDTSASKARRRPLRGLFARLPFSRSPEVPPQTYFAIQEGLQRYTHSSAKNDKDNNESNNTRRDVGSSPVASFNRDEIITGATVSLESHHKHHETSANRNTNNQKKHHFEYIDVSGIQMLESVDPTDTMADMSMSHADHPDQHFESIPHVTTNEEEARYLVATQAFQVPRHELTKPNQQKKPLHQYMIKQVHPDCCSQNNHDQWLQAITHLVRETKLLKDLSHHHHNLLTLRGTTQEEEAVFLDPSAQWDSYFLLTDRISETLAQRIDRWRHESMDRPSEPRTGTVGTWLHPTNVPTSHCPIIDSKSPAFRTRLVYAQNLASVLAFLHSKQIIVRNLHPESIGFLASDDTLQLMDLGQALQVGDDGHHNKEPSSATMVSPTTMLQQQHTEALFQMTPGHVLRYMAPEVLTKLPDSPCGYGVDSYSWAMVCFELFTLSEPFATLKPGQHLHHVCLKRPSLRPHLELYKFPKRLEALLQGAWHEDAKRRYEMIDIDRKIQRLLGLIKEPTGLKEDHVVILEWKENPIVFPRHRPGHPRTA